MLLTASVSMLRSGCAWRHVPETRYAVYSRMNSRKQKRLCSRTGIYCGNVFYLALSRAPAAHSRTCNMVHFCYDQVMALSSSLGFWIL